MFKYLLIIFIILPFKIFPQETPIKIGVLIPMSGAYADLGEDCRKSIDIARSSLPEADKKIKFIYSDSKSDPKTAITEFNRLLDQDKVIAFITSRSPVGMALNPLSEKKKVPILGAVGNSLFPINNPYAFQFFTTTKSEGIALAEHFKKQDIKKLSLITTDDDWTVAVSDALIKSLADKKDTKVDNQFVLSSESDFMSTLLRVKAGKPDVIFLNLGISQLATALKRILELQIPASIYSNFWFGKDEVVKTLKKEEVERVTFVEGKYEFNDFLEELKTAFPQTRPNFMHLACFSSAYFLLNSIEKTKDPISSESLYNSLVENKEIEFGDLKLEIKNRVVQFEIACKQYVNGMLVSNPC